MDTSDELQHQVRDQEPREINLSFTGSGSEYFRIWIVNLLLSIVTLGIYSAWAKVRRNQYFYSCTHLEEGSFDYHGNPNAILKGRVAAVVLLTLYNLAVKTSGTYTVIMLVILGAIMPWLLWRSLQFKLYNSSYRGIRFGFRGSSQQAYVKFLLWPVACVISLYTLVPLAHQRIKKFQHTESRFGASYFSFEGKVSSFYGIYALGFLAMVVGIVGFFMAVGNPFAFVARQPHQQVDPAAAKSFMLFIFGIYAWMFAIYPLFLAMMQNLIWNSTKLGDHQFHCNLKWGKLMFIIITNIIGVAFTLGFFTPFAHIRYLKYKLESMSVTVNGSLDNFVAATQEQVDATGEGMSDLLDFDLSL